MSKSSTRVRVMQLQEWMKTLKSKRVKPVNSKQSNGSKQPLQPRQIKNW